jgi:signal peptidase II
MLSLCLCFLIVLVDQATKTLIRHRLGLNDSIPVISGWFDLRYVQNTGAAWGILSGLNGWLVVLSVIMLAALVAFRHHFMFHSPLQKVALGAILGGIVGNLLDRVSLEYVVDFIDVFWRDHHFPAFNVADSAICIGVGLYFLSQIGRPAAAHVAEPAGAGRT